VAKFAAKTAATETGLLPMVAVTVLAFYGPQIGFKMAKLSNKTKPGPSFLL
jgi:hypothetical protein